MSVDETVVLAAEVFSLLSFGASLRVAIASPGWVFLAFVRVDVSILSKVLTPSRSVLITMTFDGSFVRSMKRVDDMQTMLINESF